MAITAKKGLLRQYVGTVLTVLIVDFLAMTIAATVTTNIFIRRYIQDNVYVQQERAGEALDQVIYRTLTTYSKMFTATNINALLDEDTQKEIYYQNMYESAIVSENLFGGNATFIDDTYFSSNPDLLIIRSADVDTVYQSQNWIEYVTTYIDAEDQYVIFGKKIANPSNPSLTIGATFFYLRHDVFANIIEAISGEEGYSFLVANQQSILAHQDAVKAGSRILDDTSFGLQNETHFQLETVNGVYSLVTVKSLTQLESSYHFSWQVVTIEPFVAIFSSLTNLQWIIATIASIILIISLIVAILVARNIISPINRLSQKLAQYNPLEPKVIDPQGEVTSELYQLEKRYDEMVERIYELLKKNKDDAEYQRKLELDSLQMQINPHFLYNTLDAIAWMAKIKKEAEIEHLVLALARFFRLSLHKGDKFITVEEEIELIKHFVDIELVRFPDKFSIAYHVDDKVRHYQMLKLVVQPIVENSIKHGISSLGRMGKITINANLVENDIVIEVMDDGVGFNPPHDLLEKNPSKQRQLGGYGLINVNDRIKLEYGPNYGISVESAMDIGTKVTIRLAARI